MTYKNVTTELLPDWLRTTITGEVEYNPFLFSAIGSVLVGLSGVLPLLIIPIDETANLKQGRSANTLKVLLSFAVGGLLGDVFLHLLPEAWANDAKNSTNGHPSMYSGILVLLGLIVFVAAEKLFSGMGGEINQETKEEQVNNNTKEIHPLNDKKSVNPVNGLNIVKPTNSNTKQVAGYLNLLANSIDNFTHGLAVGGSFLISLRLGSLTTCAILIHEIPHEVGDFAILLRSGFSRWDAALGQIITATAGLLGSLFAVACSGKSGSMDSGTSWILPFTAGGFLHIALVSVLPDLLQEDNPKESLKQLGALLAGIVLMAGLTLLE